MGDISNKLRILKVLDIFKEETDEERSILIKDIIKKLKLSFGENFKTDKRSIIDDIIVLRDAGYDITEYEGNNNQKYYAYVNRDFEIHELRMLVDSVASARSITKEESKKIISKIKKLTSVNYAKKLQNQIYLDEAVKAEKSIAYSIDQIHTALLNNNELIFKYGNYNIDKQFVLHRNGEFYQVEPYALVWSNDFYYLVARDKSKDKIINYRVDRMRNVRFIANSKIKKEEFHIQQHLKCCFNMYPGEEDVIEVKFHNKLINVIIDRFGKEISIRKVDDKSFIIRTKAAINEGLIRWLLTWGSDAEVISPPRVIEAMNEEIKKMNNLYNKI